MILFGKKAKQKRDSAAALKRVNGARIRYVTERGEDGTERVIGKGGAVSVTEERALLLCEGKAVFSCKTDETFCAQLLSGDGAVFSGIDRETGRQRSVTAHFTSPIRRPTGS